MRNVLIVTRNVVIILDRGGVAGRRLRPRTAEAVGQRAAETTAGPRRPPFLRGSRHQALQAVVDFVEQVEAHAPEGPAAGGGRSSSPIPGRHFRLFRKKVKLRSSAFFSAINIPDKVSKMYVRRNLNLINFGTGK
jgi:hypothetical protein